MAERHTNDKDTMLDARCREEKYETSGFFETPFNTSISKPSKFVKPFRVDFK